MIPSKRRDCRRYSNPLGRRAAHGMGLILTVVLAMGPRNSGAEQPQVRASAEPKATIADEVDARKNRPARRIAHASSEDRASSEGVVSTERRRQRSPRDRRGRRTRQVGKGDDARIHLHLNGSYELNLGNDRVVRGEGSTTIELDRAVAEKLRIGIAQTLHEAAPVGRDFLKAVGEMPATLKSTSEILQSLSDPETRKALRQVEQLLQLLPQSSPQSDSEK